MHHVWREVKVSERAQAPGVHDHGPAKAGEQRRSVIDPGKLQRELGVAQPLPLSDGFDRTAAWFRDRYVQAQR